MKDVFVTLSVKYGWNLRPTRKSTALAVDRFGPNSQPGTCRTCLLRALSKSHPSTTLYVFFVKWCRWCQDSTQFHTFYSSYDYWSKKLKKIKEEHNIGRLKDLKGFKTDQKKCVASTSIDISAPHIPQIQCLDPCSPAAGKLQLQLEITAGRQDVLVVADVEKIKWNITVLSGAPFIFSLKVSQCLACHSISEMRNG